MNDYEQDTIALVELTEAGELVAQLLLQAGFEPNLNVKKLEGVQECLTVHDNESLS